MRQNAGTGSVGTTILAGLCVAVLEELQVVTDTDRQTSDNSIYRMSFDRTVAW